MSLKPLIRKLKRLLDPYIGKYMDTFIWKYRHYIRADWEEGLLSAEMHPHRSLIADLIGSTPSIKTLLEFGTGIGINLVHLSIRAVCHEWYSKQQNLWLTDLLTSDWQP